MRENTDQNNSEYEHFLRSGNRHLIHPFAGAFLILSICLGQKVFMCYILSVYEKGILIFFISLYFAFFTVLLSSILYRQLPSCVQLSDRSRLPFLLFFQEKFVNLSPEFRSSHDIESKVPTIIEI